MAEYSGRDPTYYRKNDSYQQWRVETHLQRKQPHLPLTNQEKLAQMLAPAFLTAKLFGGGISKSLAFRMLLTGKLGRK